MSVVKQIQSGLYTCAVVYTRSLKYEENKAAIRRKLEAAALRFAAKRLLASGESLGSACLLLEQMAAELIESPTDHGMTQQFATVPDIGQ